MVKGLWNRLYFLPDDLVKHVHFFGNGLVKQEHICCDGLLKQVYFLYYGLVKQVYFCGDDLLKQVLFLYYGLVNLVHFCGDHLLTQVHFPYYGLVKQVHFYGHGLVKQICILLMVMWSMYCLWQWSSETGTFLWSWTMFQISINRTNFISEYKLLPVNLTWLSQVYGKMFFFPIS